MRLGNSSSLKQQIQQITGVPAAALEGARLSEFSVEERFSWIECRQTKVEEDKAYSLLSIFNVEMPLRYGEGSLATRSLIKVVQLSCFFISKSSSTTPLFFPDSPEYCR